ncbi:NRDE family protein [Arenibaculum pallidiluteum]|uniref:NRDE family protein n=1 Tax=Arenibaculum pallidiluteum TaxID=2812559 RepID=UPI001A959127|nr:NRDE family protein [Arenibaculum pallidiluteum]
MCSLVVLRRPGDAFPVILAANRDEMAGRPWRPPARHWEDRPHVFGGFDEAAGGTWLAMNDDGVVAAVLNRHGTLGPAPGKRSRGELVLDALDYADAAEAVRALVHLDPNAWRPFNLVILDDRDAFCVIHRGEGPIEAQPLPPGLSMITHAEPNDAGEPRIRMHRPRFAAAPDPDPAAGRWDAWQALLASTEHEPAAGPRGAMSFATPQGFGTSSSALIALPPHGIADARPVWLFCAGRPGDAPWTTLDPA